MTKETKLSYAKINSDSKENETSEKSGFGLEEDAIELGELKIETEFSAVADESERIGFGKDSATLLSPNGSNRKIRIPETTEALITLVKTLDSNASFYKPKSDASGPQSPVYRTNRLERKEANSQSMSTYYSVYDDRQDIAVGDTQTPKVIREAEEKSPSILKKDKTVATDATKDLAVKEQLKIALDESKKFKTVKFANGIPQSVKSSSGKFDYNEIKAAQATTATVNSTPSTSMITRLCNSVTKLFGCAPDQGQAH